MNFPNLSIDHISFPERKSIVKSDAHLENVIEKVKTLEVDKFNFEGEDFMPVTKIIQKQKVYLWMRLYLKEEVDIKPETKIEILYFEGMEKLDCHFMYFGKRGLERDKNGEIVNFNPEDDKKVLCLLIDAHKIDYDNADIPYMKTLFPLGKHFRPDYIRKSDFTFLTEGGQILDFYDIDF